MLNILKSVLRVMCLFQETGFWLILIHLQFISLIVIPYCRLLPTFLRTPSSKMLTLPLKWRVKVRVKRQWLKSKVLTIQLVLKIYLILLSSLFRFQLQVFKSNYQLINTSVGLFLIIRFHVLCVEVVTFIYMVLWSQINRLIHCQLLLISSNTMTKLLPFLSTLSICLIANWK